MKIKPLNTVTLNNLCACLVSKSRIYKKKRKKVCPEESSKTTKIVKNKTSPELGERMEQRYEWPLWVTHPAAIPASFPLWNGSAKKSPGIPPLWKPWLTATPAQSSLWAPVPPWSPRATLGCIPPTVSLQPGASPPTLGREKVLGGTHLPPLLTAWTPWSRAGSSPGAKSVYVLVCITKTSANNEIFIVGLRYCWVENV